MSIEGQVICYLIGFIAFLLAAFKVEVHPRVHLIGVGLAAWIFVALVSAVRAW